MDNQLREQLTELSDVVLPVSCAYSVGRTTYAQYVDSPLELRRGKRYAAQSVAGKPGGLVLGDSVVGSGHLSETADAFEFETATDRLEHSIASASLRVVATAGRAWIHPRDAQLSVGDTVLLDRRADEPIVLSFPGTNAVWASGELVTVDESFGVRITGGAGVPVPSTERGDRLEVEAVIGEAEFEIAAYAAVGEGTICPLTSSCLDLLTLQCGTEPLAFGYLSVDDATGRFVFVVTQVPGRPSPEAEDTAEVVDTDGDTELESPQPSAEQMPDGAELATLLEFYPEKELQSVLSEQRPEVAAWIVKCLSVGDGSLAAKAFAAVAVDLSAEDFAVFAAAFVSAGPQTTSAALRRRMGAYFLSRLPGEDANTLCSTLADFPAPSQTGDPRELAAAVMSGMSEDLVSRVRAAIDDVGFRRLAPTVEDVAQLSDRDVQKFLREIDMQDLARAFFDASDKVKAVITRNMSQRAASMLEDEFGYSTKGSESRRSQSRTTVRRVLTALIEQGEITL